MDTGVIKIDLSKVIKKENSVSMDGYVELDKKYLYFFKNTWIKYTDNQNCISYSGGNLNSISDYTVVLKNIKGCVKELDIKDYTFYCKESTEQYKALKEILVEKEKINIERNILLHEKNIFMKQKRDFFLKNKINKFF